MNKYKIIFVALLLLPCLSFADIVKTAIPTNSGLKLFWWPQLSKVEGWHQDMGSSYYYGINAQAPDGMTFVNAPAVIYAKAFYKPRIPETKSLLQFIQDDLQQFENADPGVQITKFASFETKTGEKLEAYRFSPTKIGNWELVAYGDEGKFFIEFCLSARNENAYVAALKDFKKFVSDYRENSENIQ